MRRRTGMMRINPEEKRQKMMSVLTGYIHVPLFVLVFTLIVANSAETRVAHAESISIITAGGALFFLAGFFSFSSSRENLGEMSKKLAFMSLQFTWLISIAGIVFTWYWLRKAS